MARATLRTSISQWSMIIRERQLRPEWMDEPGLDVRLHHHALKGLERVNALSLIHQTYWPSILRLAKTRLSREVRMLDVACGGGDVTIRLFQAARKANLKLTIDGCDLSPTAVEFAKERAAKLKIPCRFFQFNVLRDEWPKDYDAIGTSLFLHHLTTKDAIDVLSKMACAARHIVLVNDLVRSRLGYLLACFGSRILSRSPIVHSDGPASVAGAFTVKELRAMADAAGMLGATVSGCWPTRMILKWNKP